MLAWKLAVVYILCSSAQAVFNCGPGGRCSCIPETLTIVCNGQYFTKIPEFSPALRGYTKLYIRYNYIREVVTTRTYEVLDVRNNPIQCDAIIPRWVIQDSCKTVVTKPPTHSPVKQKESFKDEDETNDTLESVVYQTVLRSLRSTAVPVMGTEGMSHSKTADIAIKTDVEMVHQTGDSAPGNVVTTVPTPIYVTTAANDIGVTEDTTHETVSALKINGSMAMEDKQPVYTTDGNTITYVIVGVFIAMIVIFVIALCIGIKIREHCAAADDPPAPSPGNISRAGRVPKMGTRMLPQCM